MMIESTTLTKREMINIIRDEIRPLKEALQINDLVNRDEAVKILGISSKAFSNYIGDGRVKVASTNAAGAKFFSRKQLTGIKK